MRSLYLSDFQSCRASMREVCSPSSLGTWGRKLEEGQPFSPAGMLL